MMKFRMFLNPIEFEADNLEEANEIASEVLVESHITSSIIEPIINEKR